MYLKKVYQTSASDTTLINTRLIKNPLLMTASDAAFLLSLAPRTVYALVEAGKLPCVRIGRAVRIPRKAVMELAGEA